MSDSGSEREGDGEPGGEQVFDVQMSGHLYKLATSLKKSWRKRFFVLKDGYLLFYPHRATPMASFDLHPKGVIPLGNSTVDYMSGLHGGKDALCVRHKSYGGRQLVVSADTDAELRRWEAAIQQCKLVTFDNALAGAHAIERLRITEAQLQEMLLSSKDLLEAEQAALRLERSRSGGIERMVAQLMLENRSLRQRLQQLEATAPQGDDGEGSSGSEDEALPTAVRPRNGSRSSALSVAAAESHKTCVKKASASSIDLAPPQPERPPSPHLTSLSAVNPALAAALGIDADAAPMLVTSTGGVVLGDVGALRPVCVCSATQTGPSKQALDVCPRVCAVYVAPVPAPAAPSSSRADSPAKREGAPPPLASASTFSSLPSPHKREGGVVSSPIERRSHSLPHIDPILVTPQPSKESQPPAALRGLSPSGQLATSPIVTPPPVVTDDASAGSRAPPLELPQPIGTPKQGSRAVTAAVPLEELPAQTVSSLRRLFEKPPA